MSVLKAIRSSYFKYFFIHLLLLCLVFKRATKVGADVIHPKAVRGMLPGSGRSGAWSRLTPERIVQPRWALPPPAPHRRPLLGLLLLPQLCLRSASSPLPPAPGPGTACPLLPAAESCDLK